MSETLVRTPRELRDEVEQLIRDDLVGPVGGDEEELREAPVDQYLLGLLAPRFSRDRTVPPSREDNGADDDDAAVDELPEDDFAAGGVTADTGEEGLPEARPAAVDQLVPSGFGLTFALGADGRSLHVDASWGAYSRATSDERLDRDGRPARVWKRRACGGEQPVAIPASGVIEAYRPDPDEPEVIVHGLVRDRGDHRLITLFLNNTQQAEGGRSVERWLAQSSLAVRAADGA